MLRILLLLCVLSTTAQLAAQDQIVGTWLAGDDDGGKKQSHVKIYEKDGKYYGKIVKLLSGNNTATCTACSGKKEGKRILGMQIIEDMKPEEGRLKGGEILDVRNGNTYRCTLWVPDDNPNVLKVKGIHWTGLSKTKTWTRVD